MAWVYNFVLVSRLAQITFALVAFFVTIATITSPGYGSERYGKNDYYRSSNGNGYLMMAAIFSSFNVLTFGSLALSALVDEQALAWYMVLVLDLGSLLYAIAAGTTARFNIKSVDSGFKAWSIIATVFGFLSIVPVCTAAIGTGAMWWLDIKPPVTSQQPSKPAPAPVPSSPPPPPPPPPVAAASETSEDPKSQATVEQLVRRVEQLENERPFSTAETLARWSTISGGMTLDFDNGSEQAT